MVSLLKKFKNLFVKEELSLASNRQKFIDEQSVLDTPWAMFEVNGFENDGQIKVEFTWNDAFIYKLNLLGFTAETEEDTVQLFFYASQMKPTAISDIDGDETIQSEDLPQLSSNANRIAS